MCANHGLHGECFLSLKARTLTKNRLVFFYPLLGLINVFVYVLKYLTLPSVLSDIALMDIVAGHFGYLEFYSASKLSFPFAGDLTSIARAAVKRSREVLVPQSQPGQGPDLGRDDLIMTDFSQNESARGIQTGSQTYRTHADVCTDFSDFESFDFASGSWPSFMPSMSDVSSMAADCFLDNSTSHNNIT